MSIVKRCANGKRFIAGNAKQERHQKCGEDVEERCTRPPGCNLSERSNLFQPPRPPMTTLVKRVVCELGIERTRRAIEFQRLWLPGKFLVPVSFGFFVSRRAALFALVRY